MLDDFFLVLINYFIIMSLTLIRKNLLFTLLFAIVLMNSCKHSPDDVTIIGPGDTSLNPVSCSPDTAYFVNTILPMLRSNCATSGCHDAATAKEEIVMENYNSIMKIVKAGNASNSKLYKVITDNSEDRMPPSPQNALTSEQIVAVKKWIDQGAKNNSCTESLCDSVNVSFAANVFPIFQNNCTGCHSGNAPSAGIKLTNYSEISAVVAGGRLVGAIKHWGGYASMPPDLTLSVCEIAKIDRWIANGTPNN